LVATVAASIAYVVINPRDKLSDSAIRIVQQLKLTQQAAVQRDWPQQVKFNLATNEIEFIEQSIKFGEAVSMTIKTAQHQVIDTDLVGITFYPDGSSSGGVIELENEREKIGISIVWISGKIQLEQRVLGG
jgi:general secretion pathway protein H